VYIQIMSIDELEAAALKLNPKQRARLAGKLLESLEALSREENERIWLDEAARRDRELQSDAAKGISADEVFRDARSGLG